MIRAHRILLLPNNRQLTYFKKACGIKRFAWNWALAKWDELYQAGQKPNGQALKKEFTALIDEQWPWMREISSYAYQAAFSDLDQAYRRFFSGLANRPKFKKHGVSRDSFYQPNTAIKVEAKQVKIQKLGWCRMKDNLRFQGKIMGARIGRVGKRWFISIQVEIPDQLKMHKSQATTGVDLGVKSLATLANGQKIAVPAGMSRYQRRLACLQRQLRPGIRQKGSIRHKKIKAAVQRLHQKIAGIRQNTLHQATARLVKEYAVIGIEDLNVKGMTASAKGTKEAPGKKVAQKAGLNRGLLNASFGEFRRQLEYKAEHTGTQIVLINRFAPSSKTCSACGSYQAKMPLKVREWTCPDCGAQHDRDHNAAKNLRQLAVSTLDARESHARGVDGNGAGSPALTSHNETGTRRLGKLHPQRKSGSGGLTTTPSSDAD